jgi:hypothetical protein
MKEARRPGMIGRGTALMISALLLQSSGVGATPLDVEACSKLETEQEQLEQAGARGNLEKGADWGKANLDAGKLAQVRRLLEIDEQLIFRCRGKTWAAIHDDDDEESEKPESKSASKDTGKSKPGDGAAKEKAGAGDNKKAAAAKSAPAPKKTTAVQGQAAKNGPKAKKTVDDAYRPPAKPGTTGSTAPATK